MVTEPVPEAFHDTMGTPSRYNSKVRLIAAPDKDTFCLQVAVVPLILKVGRTFIPFVSANAVTLISIESATSIAMMVTLLAIMMTCQFPCVSIVSSIMFSAISVRSTIDFYTYGSQPIEKSCIH